MEISSLGFQLLSNHVSLRTGIGWLRARDSLTTIEMVSYLKGGGDNDSHMFMNSWLVLTVGLLSLLPGFFGTIGTH